MSTLPIIAFMLSVEFISFAESGTAAFGKMKVRKKLRNSI